jgi:glyoxalase family protein
MGRETLEWWREHFAELEIPHGEIAEIDGRATLWFQDREGQRLSLIDDEGKSPAGHTWRYSPLAPELQIRGLGPVMLSVPVLKPTAELLTKVLGMREVRAYAHPEIAAHKVHVFEMRGGGAHAEVHAAVQPDLEPARQGAGGVHHVAFRCPDADYEAWEERLNKMRVPNSGQIDRYWFRSLYLREPNGILLEIATDGPGFTADEDLTTLGDRIVLPPFLEHQRHAIVSRLKPLD